MPPLTAENQDFFAQYATTLIPTLIALLTIATRIITKWAELQFGVSAKPTLSPAVAASSNGQSNGNGYRVAIDMGRGIGFLAKQAQECEDNVERLEKDNNVLRMRVYEQARQLRRVELHNATLEAKIVGLEKQLQEKDNQIAALERRLAELESNGHPPPKVVALPPPKEDTPEEDESDDEPEAKRGAA